MRQTCTLLIILLFMGWWSAQAQYAPQFYQVLTLTNETSDTTGGMLSVLLTVNTDSLVSRGELNADLSDLRFGNPCLADTLPYWIQDSTGSDTTRIWLRVPAIVPGDSLLLQMYYGDTAAVAASNFDSVFTDAYISSGNDTLSGTQLISWFQVNPGDTIFLADNQPLFIQAAVSSIAGTIFGTGKGFPGGTIGPNPGSGPGGGQISTGGGGGGGSYGGDGGTGGYDSGDTPGAGGSAYGDALINAIQAGSGGASTDLNTGGNGGGAFGLTAQLIILEGSIVMDGASGEQPGGSRGGGGGAGGGILLNVESLFLGPTSVLSAAGGSGSIGISTFNDDGGGGGGGRLKVFRETVIGNLGSSDVTGGPVGPNGDILALPGSDGTTFDSIQTFAAPMVSFGASLAIFTPLDTAICAGDSLLIGGAFVSLPGQYIDTLSNFLGCDSVLTIVVDTFPTYAIANAAGICRGDSLLVGGAFQTVSGIYVDSLLTADGCDSVITTDLTVADPVEVGVTVGIDLLSADAAGATYQWVDCATNEAIAGETDQTFAPSSSGNYAVVVTQGECTDTSACIPLILSHLSTQGLAAVTVAPNPSQGRFVVSIPQLMPGLDLQVFTSAGERIMHMRADGAKELMLDLQDQPAGLYLLRLRHDGEASTLRLIKK